MNKDIYFYDDSHLPQGEWAKTKSDSGFCDLIAWEHEEGGSERSPIAENILEEVAHAIVPLKLAYWALFNTVSLLVESHEAEGTGFAARRDDMIVVPEGWGCPELQILLRAGVVRKKDEVRS